MSELEELAGWVELEGCFNFRDLGGYLDGVRGDGCAPGWSFAVTVSST